MDIAPSSIFCVERERLIQSFLRAVSELDKLQIAQATAYLVGDDFSFEEGVVVATRARDDAKYAVLTHKEEHGC